MFDLKFLRKRSEMFGLDIGSSAVKVIQLRETNGVYTLTGLGVVSLPPDVISEGAIKDPLTVTGAIKEAIAKAGVKSTDAVISICGRELIIKKIQIPAVPPKELPDAIQLEAEHHIPFAIDEVFLDYHVVGTQGDNMDLILVAVKKSKVMEYIGVVDEAGVKSTGAVISICGRELIIKKIQIPAVPPKELPDAIQLEAEHHIPFAIDEVFLDYHLVSEQGGTMDLILVAVKKSKVMEYIGVVDEAGVTPLIVDVDCFALCNQFELNAPEQGEEAVALIDIGASIMKTNVIRGGATIFARDIPFGGNQYTQAIAQRLSVPFEAAEAAKLGKDPNVECDTLVPAIEEVSHELSLEVQRTFDYFASTAESERIGKIVLAGGCSQVAGLSEYLASNWGIPVELARPFDRIEVEAPFAEGVAGAGPSLAVAVGLGLRKAGDKGK